MAALGKRGSKDFRQEFLTCSICANPFDKQTRVPKCLPCLHCFCTTCLRHHVAGRSDIKCPACRKLCIVPENGADGFVTNFNIENLKDYQHLHDIGKDDDGKDNHVKCTNCDTGDAAVGYCYDCTAYVCQQCTSEHQRSRLRQNRSHKIETLEDMQKKSRTVERHVTVQYCEVHTKTKKALSVFCQTCQKPVCDTCGLTDHKTHNLQDLETSIRQTIESLKELSGKLKNKSTPLEQLMVTLDVKVDEIGTLHTQRVGVIDECFDELEEKLRSRRLRSKEELDELCKAMTTVLRDQKVEIDALVTRFMSAVDFADHTCRYANPVELFQHRNMVTQQIEDLIKIETTIPCFTQPLANSVLTFTNHHTASVDKFDQAMSDMGSTKTSSTMASRCYVEGLLQESTINTPQTIVIYTVDCNMKRQTEGGDYVTVSLQVPDGTTEDCAVQDTQDGLYTTCFTPEDVGHFQLEVKVFGRPINGSPFQMNVTEDLVVQEQEFAVVEYPIALVGYTHDISIDLSKDCDEARADRLQCEVVTQTGDNVSCKVKGYGNRRYTVQYTPPIEGCLSLCISLNGVPLPNSPYTINVSPASPRATRVKFEKPIINQIWSIKIHPCDYRQQKMSVPRDALTASITDLTTKKKHILTPTKRGKHDSFAVQFVPETGPYKISVLLYNIAAFEEHVDVSPHLPFTLQQQFPTGLASGGNQQNLIYSSDTMDGKLYVLTARGSVEYSINLAKTTETSQIAVDNQGRLVLLFPQSKSIHFLDPQGNELSRWRCQKRNSRPVTLTCTKDGRIVIVDARDPSSMFIYKSDGTCITQKTLPSKSVVDGVNNICVDAKNRIVLAHHTEPVIHLYDSEGKQVSQFSSEATSVQLAVAATSAAAEDLLLVSQLGQVRVFRMTMTDKKQDCIATIPVVPGHIYTSIAITNDGCVLCLDVGQKQIVKYGYSVKEPNVDSPVHHVQ